MNRELLRNSRGFSLTEAMVAALVLVLTTACVLTVFTLEGGAVGHIGRRMQAMDFCRQSLEQLRNDSGADTWPNAGPLSPGVHNDPLPAGDFTTNLGATRDYTVTNVGAGPDYKSATVTVTWNEPTQ